jgi:PAS domain S-box-containing protein
MNGTTTMFALFTPLSYWLLIFLWTLVLLLYLRIKKQAPSSSAIAVLLVILSIDALRTLIESIYFGFYFNSQYGLLPTWIHHILERPELLFLPKLLNIVAAVVVLMLLIKRWLPAEIKEHETQKDHLRKIEEFNKLLFDKSPVGLALCGMNGDLTKVNSAYAEIIGYTVEETLKLSYWDITPIDYQESERQQVEYLQKTGHYGPYEKEYRHKDGHLVPVELDGVIIETPDGKQIWSSVRDISKRKIAETALQESSEQFKRGIMNAPFPIMIHAQDGEVVRINDAWTKLSGYKHSDIPATSDWAEKAYGQKMDDIKSLISSLFETDSIVHEGEFQVRTKAGESRIWDFSSGPLGELPDKRRLVISMATDITERKLAEEKLSKMKADLQNTFDISPGIICVANIESGFFTKCNPAVTDILGYSAEEFTAKPLLEFVHPDDRQRTIEEVSKQLEGYSIANFHNRYQCKDGSYKWLSWGGTKADNDGNVYAVATDITQLKQAEVERLELEFQLRQKYKMEAVGVMAGGLAHNFNNNLTIILGNLELSKMKLPPQSELEKYLDSAKIATVRSRDLVKQIMTYSRIDAISQTPMQLSLLLNETISLLESTIPSSVKLQQEINPNSDQAYIQADASQIQECLLNLCNNAVHAMEEKGELLLRLEQVELKQKDIRARNDCPPGKYLCLSIQDNGCGFPAAIREKIFDPFFTTKNLHEGTGMGLATVQGAVEQHHGMITVESGVGQGTTFNLYFPVVDQPEKEAVAVTEVELQKGTERILLVDDDEMIVNLNEQLLSEMGYQVTAQTDSVEALKIFSANVDGYDLVMTDQTMPELSGVELIQKIKTLRPEIPTILCTGYSSKVNDEEARQLGISAYLMKPVDFPELLQVIRNVLEKPPAG